MVPQAWAAGAAARRERANDEQERIVRIESLLHRERVLSERESLMIERHRARDQSCRNTKTESIIKKRDLHLLRRILPVI